MSNPSRFSVNYHGSDPRLELDECWDGRDFDTLGEARAEYDRADAEHVAACRETGELWVEFAQGTRGSGTNASLVILDVRCVRAETSADRAACAADLAAERSEFARQQGLAFGLDAYNEATS